MASAAGAPLNMSPSDTYAQRWLRINAALRHYAESVHISHNHWLGLKKQKLDLQSDELQTPCIPQKAALTQMVCVLDGQDVRCMLQVLSFMVYKLYLLPSSSDSY